MTTQQILQKIREVNPELMELSFGCEVVVRFSNDTFSKQVLIKKKKFENREHSPRYKGNRYYYTWSLKDNGYKPMESDIVEVIGHPPQLNHLLRAIGEADGGQFTEFMNFLWRSNVKTSVDLGPYKELFHYDLTKTVEQNLDESEELREFLSEIIK